MTPPLGAQWANVRSLALRGYERIASLLGREVETEARSTHTIRTLAAGETGDVPPAYLELFSTEPISDPTLLAGRESALADAMLRWNRWRSGQGTPLMFVGRAGTGITSFVNVLAESIRATDGTAVIVRLSGRVKTEGELVELIARGLGMDPLETFDELAAAVLETEAGILPNAVGIDTMEHVYLRCPAGTDVFERFLTFMSETDAQVFWFGGITTSAWQVMAQSEPTAVSQVETMDLSPLSAGELKDAVLLRHRRSGLELVFKEPGARGSLRQRVRRLRGRQGRQDLTEDAFFDQLHRASLGTLRLALFQWLVVADFQGEDGQVCMGRIERHDFSMLDSLDLTQSFSLKAFLEHRTLTLGEHDAVFRLPRQESYQVFESLANRQLIEAVGGTGAKRPEIQEGVRYRVRPLLEGAVIHHLELRNIIH